jgi:hypothetical protein
MGNYLILDSIFYLSSLPFIWVEIFQLINRFKVSSITEQLQTPKKWIAFYLLKLFYLLWIVIGLFTENYKNFIIIIVLSLLRFFILKINKNFYINLYDLISSIIRIILFLGFTFLGVVLLL